MKKGKLRQTAPKTIHFATKKKPTNRQFSRRQPQYSEGEDYFHQNQQQNNNSETSNGTK